MSYDVDFVADLGGPEPSVLDLDDHLNYTYNVSPMFREALGGQGLRRLHDRTAAESIASLRRAIERMTDDPARYLAMNPKNGWGDYDGALSFLKRILRQCEAHPHARLRIT